MVNRQIVSTYQFEPMGRYSSNLKLTLRGAGQMHNKWPGTAEKVRHYFLFERFKPYIKQGKHLRE